MALTLKVSEMGEWKEINVDQLAPRKLGTGRGDKMTSSMPKVCQSGLGRTSCVESRIRSRGDVEKGQ